MLELMQQDLEILWPRPGCSIHEPWPPFAPCRSCPTAHCAFGGSPWGVTGADGEAATCNDCFLLKPLFETAFRHDLQRSRRTFKARVQSGIQNERSESDPKPTRMLLIQQLYDSLPMVKSNPSLDSYGQFDLDPQIQRSREGFPHHDNQVLLKSLNG